MGAQIVRLLSIVHGYLIRGIKAVWIENPWYNRGVTIWGKVQDQSFGYLLCWSELVQSLFSLVCSFFTVIEFVFCFSEFLKIFICCFFCNQCLFLVLFYFNLVSKFIPKILWNDEWVQINFLMLKSSTKCGSNKVKKN